MKLTENKNLFRCTAHLYDLFEKNEDNDDIAFYQKRAPNPGCDILELACGTGRVTIPLANAGYQVWGIDLSEEMLAQFGAKMTDLPETVQKRVHVVHDDITKFEIKKTFSLIIIPCFSFEMLIAKEQQDECLRNVHRHLANDGLFIMHVFRGDSQFNDSWVKPETLDFEVVDPKTGNTVRRTVINREIDREKQIIYPELIYYITDKTGVVQRLSEPVALKYYYQEEMRTLLKSHGFMIVEEMGYYDGRPIHNGPDMLFVCKK